MQLELFPELVTEIIIEMTEEEAKYAAANLIEEYILQDISDTEVAAEIETIVKILRG